MRFSLLAVAAAAALSVAPMAHATVFSNDFSALVGPIAEKQTYDYGNNLTGTYQGTTVTGNLFVDISPADNGDVGPGLGNGYMIWRATNGALTWNWTFNIRNPVDVFYQVFGGSNATGFLGTNTTPAGTMDFTVDCGGCNAIATQGALHGTAQGFAAANQDIAIYNTVTFDTAPPVPPSVPEPASWALMLVGFFGLGAALRARRQPLFAAL